MTLHPIKNFLIDYSPKDSTELMERPFFSLSKGGRRRLKPIEYESPDGSVWVRVTANPNYGMATIWDADILIAAISHIVAQRDAGSNDVSGIFRTTPHALLKSIARGISKNDYIDLEAAIMRLRTTQVETNIRAGGRKVAAFHYLGDMEGTGDEGESSLKTLTLRVPDWLLEGLEKRNYVTLDEEYFKLTGGMQRAIYRMARKHAGAQKEGWTCRISLLYEKSGSDSAERLFAFRLRQMCEDDDLPRYAMTLTTTGDGSPAIHFIDRAYLAADETDRRQSEQARRHRDQARSEWIDRGQDPKFFDAAFEGWIERGNAPADFVRRMKGGQIPLLA